VFSTRLIDPDCHHNAVLADMDAVDQQCQEIKRVELRVARSDEAREVSKEVYELVVGRPDGTERVKHFTDSAALNARQVALNGDLEDEGWSGPHGWNL
jgi:hypothetical protein